MCLGERFRPRPIQTPCCKKIVIIVWLDKKSIEFPSIKNRPKNPFEGCLVESLDAYLNRCTIYTIMSLPKWWSRYARNLPSKIKWDLTNRPLSCDRAIRYSGFFGVRESRGSDRWRFLGNLDFHYLGPWMINDDLITAALL